MKTSSKYGNLNLELLLPLKIQETQDKRKVTYELGLSNSLKTIKQSPYSKVTSTKKFFLGLILIGDMFDVYCRYVFDPGGK